jgi:hypothetical protein
MNEICESSETDNAPWTEPTEAAVAEKIKTYGMTHGDAYEAVKEELAEGAKRREGYAPEASAEIAALLKIAAAANARATQLALEQESREESVNLASSRLVPSARKSVS